MVGLKLKRKSILAGSKALIAPDSKCRRARKLSWLQWSIAVMVMLLLVSAPAGGQTRIRDAVILKNGRSYVGFLLASPSPDSIRIMLDDSTVAAFHRDAVSSITKESVLPGYVPEENRIPSSIGIDILGGFSGTGQFGPGVGIEVMHVSRAGFRLSAMFQLFPIKEIGGRIPSTLGSTPGISTFVEKATAVAAYVTLGKLFAFGNISVAFSGGAGFVRVNSDIVYSDGTDQSVYFGSFVTAPGEGAEFRFSIPVLASVRFHIAGRLYAGVGILAMIKLPRNVAKGVPKDYYSLYDKDLNNILTQVRIGVDL